jgi:hypothetical protein
MTELIIENDVEKKKLDGLLISSVNLENIIDLMVYEKATARSQATQDEVDRIAKEAKTDWWIANKERFIK